MKLTTRTTKKEMRIIIRDLQKQNKKQKTLIDKYEDVFEKISTLMKKQLEREKKSLIWLLKFYLIAILLIIAGMWLL